jgi:hypothetical protein
MDNQASADNEAAERAKSVAFAKQKVARGKEFATKPGKQRLALSEFKQGLQFAVSFFFNGALPCIVVYGAQSPVSAF